MFESHLNLNPHGAIGQPSPSIGVIGEQPQAIDNLSPAPARPAAHPRQVAAASLSQGQLGGRPRTPINRDWDRDTDTDRDRDVVMGERREQADVESDLTNLLVQTRLHRTGLFSDREVHSQPHSHSQSQSQSQPQSEAPSQRQRQYQSQSRSQPQSQSPSQGKDDVTGGIDDFRKRWERESREGGKRFDEETWDRSLLGMGMGMGTVQRQGRGSPAPGGFGIGLGSGLGLGGKAMGIGGTVGGSTQSKMTTGTFAGYQPFMGKISPVSSAQYRPSLSPSNHHLPSSTYGNQAPSQPQSYTQPQTPSHTAAPNTLVAGAGTGGQNDTTATQITRHLESLTILLNPLLAQADEVERLRKEVEMWKSEWARAERERKRLEEKVGGMGMELEKAVGKSRDIAGPSFTAVLIDGNGLIFQDPYLQAGFKGGQLAAHHLLSSIPNLAPGSPSSKTTHTGIIAKEVTLGLDSLPVNNNKGGDDDDYGGKKTEKGGREMGSVVVQIFVNKQGLGGALIKSGIVPSWNVYDQFWQGLSSSHELFTVCDVGQGKEASDAKIREYLNLYASNAQCRSIILGASHDNGYANVLSSLQTGSRLSNVVLLKGYATLAPQLKTYSSRVVSIPDLFRLEKVPPPLPSFTSSTTADVVSSIQAGGSPDLLSAVTGLAGVSFSSIVASSPKDKEADFAGPYGANVRDNTNTATSARNISSADIGKARISTPKRDEYEESEEEIEEFEYEWGSGAQFKGRSDLASGFAPGSAKKKKIPAPFSREANFSRVGGKDREMDDEWTEMAPKKKVKGKRKEAAEYVRTLKPRPCHTFYLGPRGCKNGDDCQYGHEYKLNAAQLDELARLAKCIMCPYVKDGRCRYSDDDCVYGHQCPNPDKCVFGETCRFYELPNGHGELN